MAQLQSLTQKIMENTQHRPMAKGQESRSSPMATSWYSTVIETPSSYLHPKNLLGYPLVI
jgi:hypothetical protein